MNEQVRRTLHSRTLNLLLLRMVLTTAEKDVPSQVPLRDSNEQLAFELIQKIKAEYQALNPFEGLAIEPPRPIFSGIVREMADSHA